MPLNKYVNIIIGSDQVEVSSADKIPLSISYSLEDIDSFQSKQSSKALSIVIPATLLNSKVSNNFTNPGIEDLTAGQIYKSNRRGIIEANGQELLVGKVFLVGGTHGNKVQSYEYSFYGDNADWLIDLQEATLYDFVKDLNFVFSRSVITDSWNFDGYNLNKPYVFAPVRYAQPMDSQDVAGTVIEDYNMKPDYMRPSLSKYWILYEGFKSLGYTIKSDFLDSQFFRRQVMPWTWGNFLMSEGTKLDNLDFLAKTSTKYLKTYIKNGDEGIIDLHVDNDSINGAFDNNGVYEYDNGAFEMKFTYTPLYNYGLLSATFYFNMFVNAQVTNNSDIELRVQYFKNGVKLDNGNDDGNGTMLLELNAPFLGSKSYVGSLENWLTIQISPGDVISAKVWLDITSPNLFSIAKLEASVDAFELDYFRIPFGGNIDFNNYLSFKKYKFLDFFAGIVDEFDLTFKTDATNKVIYIEPQHPYSIFHSQQAKSGGYFNGNTLDWEHKQDLSKESTMSLFSEYERELELKYQEDENDGSYKIIKERLASTPGLGKYVFPDRFKVGKREMENRFFSVVMHYNVAQWRGLGTLNDTPQMICLIPENVANTSREEAQYIFKPKSAYYKGLVPEWGWVFDGAVQTSYPYMFAVNYKDGGQNDPILSYCDEKIGTHSLTVTGVGLLRRFFLQRLEIMNNGQYYRTYFKLNNTDIANILHREYIICQGQKWEIVEINNYDPLSDDSTEVLLRKWVPITE